MAPCSRAGVDVAAHLVPVLGGDQRAHVRVRVGAVADAQLGQPGGDGVDQPVTHVPHRDGHRQRHAPLTRRAVCRRDHRVRGHVHVGVRQHQRVVLRPAESLHALAVRRTGLVDVARDRRGADEADGGDVGVLEQRVDGLLVALDHGEDPVGQACVLPHLREEQRGGGVLLARLEHERVAAGDGVGAHPQRHHRGEVERRDAGDDAERLTDRVDVDAGRRLLGEAALEQLRDPGGELDVLQAARDLAGGVAEDLAVLGGDDGGQLVGAGVQQLAEGEQHGGPARQRGRTPLLGRGPGRRRRRRRPPRRWPGRRGRSPVRWRGCGRARCGRRARQEASVDPVRDAGAHGGHITCRTLLEQCSFCYVTKHGRTSCVPCAPISTEPGAKGVARAVSRAVRDGALAAGTRLPPIRSVAAALDLSPTTVSAGWALLARSGTIRTDGRRGTTVAETASHADRPATAARWSVRPTSTSTCPPASPTTTCCRASQHALDRLDDGRHAGGYLDEPVLPELMRLLRADWPYDAEELTVVDGAMDALDLVARSLRALRRPRGGRAPLLPAAAGPAGVDRRRGGRRPDGRRGPDPEHAGGGARLADRRGLPAAAGAEPDRGLPDHRARRRARRRSCAATGVPVVEDDSAGAISTAPDLSLGRWIPEQTVHVRSYSKSHGPDLRLAALGGPDRAAARTPSLDASWARAGAAGCCSGSWSAC